ncbi:response regulator receiver modulated diguanylate cyclase/phosphodiesterase with PAS/PAC sensor [gamma proteobacterium HTCC5015]|nr:response regulator receiver modulated diguanylate cyclase/phosphodiesterase with PAS/PAC sensor [gamma proteobacterium HTCC5015]
MTDPFSPDSEYDVPILVVDDTRDNLDLLEALLIGEGYQNVILVEDGPAALQAVQDNADIGLVLLDLMMPGMSGYEVCAQLVNNPETQDIPVIAVTGGGYVQNEALEKSFLAGAIDYIPKPINEVELFARVKVAIQLYLERRLRKVSVAKTTENEERFRTIFHEAPIGIAQLDSDLKIATANVSFQHLVGVATGQLVGCSVYDLLAEQEASAASEGSARDQLGSLLAGSKTSAEVALRVEGREPVWVNLFLKALLQQGYGAENSYILIAENITEKKQVSDHVHEIAYHDNLTGGANRARFQDEVARAIAHAEKASSQFAVLILDLDYFKTINDSLGHEVGDEMLKEVARTLQECIRDSDLLARLGGDEFGLLLPRVRSPQDACTVAQKVLNRMQEPICIENHEFYAGASIGISFYPQDGESMQGLMRSADTAMYRAKELGRQNYQLFNPSMDRNVERRLDLEQDLRRGIKEDEFYLVYQPQVDASVNRVTGLEALVRWKHPSKGTLAPHHFLELAEETGLILMLGDRLIRQAIKQSKQWLDAGMDPHVVVSVNLSLRQFQQHDLVRRLAQYLEDAQLPSKNFGIEVTESINALDKSLVIAALDNFRQMGLQIALDDFGMGYSSLNHLRYFPLDALKVDRSFIVQATESPVGRDILQTIIQLGNTLGLKVVAEGVETDEQHQLVQSMGGAAIQGYYYSPPLEAEAVIDWLNSVTLTGA